MGVWCDNQDQTPIGVSSIRERRREMTRRGLFIEYVCELCGMARRTARSPTIWAGFDKKGHSTRVAVTLCPVSCTPQFLLRWFTYAYPDPDHPPFLLGTHEVVHRRHD